jgi:zinc metalloprotease ZmpB
MRLRGLKKENNTMYQEFNQEHNVQVNLDDKGVARELLHAEEPFVSEAPTPQLAAAEYLSKYGGLLGIEAKETDNLSLAPEAAMVDAGGELRFRSEKKQFDMTTVTYRQTYLGLPVWHGGVSIHMKHGPFRVVSSQSTRHPDLDAKRPSKAALTRVKKITKTTLAKQLGLSAKQKEFDLKTLAIENVRLVVYRYAEAKREIVEPPPEDGKAAAEPSTLPLPHVAKGIEEGRHYVSAEVQFALAPKGRQTIHWTAIVEAETLSVLYLRAFVDDVNGLVFQDDPMTTNGGPLPNANNASLNPVRTSVLLQGLVAPIGGSQALTGNNIQLSDVELPTVAPPTEPGGTDFNFNARTNDFAAVNAYYHCDRFFRLMQDLGFSVSGFFGSGTTFPSAVDHRGLGGNVVNAHCVGTGGGLGIARTTFALADTGDTTNPIGIACDYRVVLHELGGHGVLYPHVHSPNFGFSHSAGDSVAAITCDPDTHAPDRFVTFPWVNIGRRHDRTPAAGFGWAGNIALHPFDPVLDGGGYNNEQILCTTMFRFYRSIGGDSVYLDKRKFAARYAVYLILRAISTLTPATNPSNAAGFATALMTADLGDWTSEGQAGGAYGKVIRWAFEKQGLYQPAGTPTPNNNEGAPPAIDVYIDDGRHGEYQYQPNHWSCQAIWNRRHNDGGTTHEEPIVGQTNFAYVKIKNRGTQTATNVIVKAYHANPGIGLVYPNDWQPMATAQLAAANVPPNSSAEITVGPFQWVPSQIGHECMFMVASATGDPSNISNMTAGDSIPEWRLVPNDNNIGQRNVFPVAGGSGLKGLVKSLDGVKILIKNPLNAGARVLVKVELPKFLMEGGWEVTFANPGAGAFALKAGESKPVVLKLKPGKTFTASDVKKAGRDAVIHIEASANGIPVGGMSYQLDSKLK